MVHAAQIPFFGVRGGNLDCQIRGCTNFRNDEHQNRQQMRLEPRSSVSVLPLAVVANAYSFMVRAFAKSHSEELFAKWIVTHVLDGRAAIRVSVCACSKESMESFHARSINSSCVRMEYASAPAAHKIIAIKSAILPAQHRRRPILILTLGYESDARHPA